MEWKSILKVEKRGAKQTRKPFDAFVQRELQNGHFSREIQYQFVALRTHHTTRFSLHQLATIIVTIPEPMFC